MVAQDKILIPRYYDLEERLVIPKLRLQIGFVHFDLVDEYGSADNFDLVARNSHHPLDEGLAVVSGIPEDDYVTPVNVCKTVDEPIHEYAFLVHQLGLHACAFNLHRLYDEDDNEDGRGKGKDYIPKPGSKFDQYSGTGVGWSFDW